MNFRKVFIDIEIMYVGDFDENTQRAEMFHDFKNWKFVAIKKFDDVETELYGMIGMLILDCDFDKGTGIYSIVNKKFVQLYGHDVTKEALLENVGYVNEIIHFHGRSTTDWKGHIGFDIPIINSQLGVNLDKFPGIKSVDLELTCHRNGLYGGQKAVEGVLGIERQSGVKDGSDAVQLMINIGRCSNESLKDKLIRKFKLYNKEDISGLLRIDHFLRKIKYR